MTTDNKKAHTNASVPAVVPNVNDETLTKLASRDADIRASGLLDVFEQSLPNIPADYVFKDRDRKSVEDNLHVAYDLVGGTRRLILYAHQNYGEFIKLYARLLPEAQKAGEGATTVVINNALPVSALDSGQYGDVYDTPGKDGEADQE